MLSFKKFVILFLIGNFLGQGEAFSRPGDNNETGLRRGVTHRFHPLLKRKDTSSPQSKKPPVPAKDTRTPHLGKRLSLKPLPQKTRVSRLKRFSLPFRQRSSSSPQSKPTPVLNNNGSQQKRISLLRSRSSQTLPQRKLLLSSFSQRRLATQRPESRLSSLQRRSTHQTLPAPVLMPPLKTPVPLPPVLILSLDGGGVRGLGTAIILHNLEDAVQRKLGRPIRLSQMFDLYAGSSTGGLISLMLATHRPIEECLQLYRTQASRIFSRSLLHRGLSLNGLVGPKYSVRSGLSPLLKEKFGDTLLRDTQRPVFVTAYEPKKSRLHLLDSMDAKSPSSKIHLVKIREAARATSAAPTYFAAKTIGSLTLIDGGVAANNPASLAVVRAQQLYPNRPCIVISVGTGHEHTPLEEPRAGLWHFGPGAINHLMTGTTAATHRGLTLSLKERYHRLQFKSSLGLDTTDPVQLQRLEATADALKHSVQFHRVVDCLTRHLRAVPASR